MNATTEERTAKVQPWSAFIETCEWYRLTFQQEHCTNATKPAALSPTYKDLVEQERLKHEATKDANEALRNC